MKTDVSVDVWYGEGIMTKECCTISNGKKEMKRLKKKGMDSIRMYTDYHNGKRFYYHFRDNKIVKESNVFDN